ncbi:MAG: hypothetical protein DCC49_07460 [Acidobacteria bacterium]|nr:MAG: hypothetical protein DCC49_07460 [Acidobacteriota bacterium]
MPLVLPRERADKPWHLIANPRITALAHAGGWIDIYSATAGLIRLTTGSNRRSQWRITDRNGVVIRPQDVGTRFGMSYAEWQYEDHEIKVRRRVHVLPDGPPALKIETEIDSDIRGNFCEDFSLDPLPLLIGGLMSRYTRASSEASLAEKIQWDATLVVTSISRSVTDLYRSAASKLMRYRFEASDYRVVAFPNRSPRGDGPTLMQIGMPVVYMTSAGDDSLAPSRDPRSLQLASGFEGDARFAVVVGLGDGHDSIDEYVKSMSRASRAETASAQRQAWSLSFEASSGDDLPKAIERESAWHATYLKSLQVHDDYFDARYPSQASAYGFIHGLQGAPRDYAISTVPLTLIDPAGAREALEVIMRMTRPSGAMHYAHTGRGQVVSGGIHSYPSDLPIFLLWALTEYVWATGDFEFLSREIPFYPKERETASTVAERIELAFRYLRDELGCGEHGLLRVGSGDWSDPITAMAPDRKAFHERGESGFNTGFAAYALPRAAALMQGRTAEEMRDFANILSAAMEQTWNGNWFYRGFDGRGVPLGNDHLFLDGQVFCLIADIGGRREELASVIKERLMDPSKIGPTILDKPHRVRFGILPPGWDCNGGVWAAINGLAAWGLSLADASIGWECLSKQLLRAHARAYPHIWYGIWSGPDAYNSWMGDREGETFVQPATPMAEFPQPNSNAHAGPLLGLMRVLGIEAGPNGLEVRGRPGADNLPFDSWRLSCHLTRLGSHAEIGHSQSRNGMHN